MITTTAWVPRGFAAPFPTKYKFDEEEFERIASLAKLQLDDAQDDLDEAREKEANGGVSDKEDDDTAMKVDTRDEYVSASCSDPRSIANWTFIGSRSTTTLRSTTWSTTMTTMTMRARRNKWACSAT